MWICIVYGSVLYLDSKIEGGELRREYMGTSDGIEDEGPLEHNRLPIYLHR